MTTAHCVCYIIMINNCLSYLNLISQLEGDVFPYCPLVIACAYSDVKIIINVLLQFLGSGNNICICYSTGRSDIRDIFHEL